MLGPAESIVGGISTLVQTIVPALRQQVSLYYLATVRQRLPSASGKLSSQNIALAISQYLRFTWALYRFRPQVIHIHTSRGIAWLKDTFFIMMSKACRRNVVLHIHGGNFDELYGKETRIVRYYTRKALRHSDAVVAVSAEWKKRLASIIPDDQIHVLRNCVAVDHFAPRSFSRSVTEARALFLGCVGPDKGVFDLLQCMSRLKSSRVPLHLWIAGGEEGKGDLRRANNLLEELGLKDTCQLIGEVRREKKARLLSEADFFVLPSYHEGLPMAILEAMASGLAVVATPVGGIPEVVRDGYNGFLIPAGDVASLAEKLSILGNHSDLRNTMGRRSREIAERELDVKPYVTALAALYNSLAVVQGKG